MGNVFGKCLLGSRIDFRLLVGGKPGAENFSCHLIKPFFTRRLPTHVVLSVHEVWQEEFRSAELKRFGMCEVFAADPYALDGPQVYRFIRDVDRLQQFPYHSAKLLVNKELFIAHGDIGAQYTARMENKVNAVSGCGRESQRRFDTCLDVREV